MLWRAPRTRERFLSLPLACLQVLARLFQACRHGERDHSQAAMSPWSSLNLKCFDCSDMRISSLCSEINQLIEILLRLFCSRRFKLHLREELRSSVTETTSSVWWKHSYKSRGVVVLHRLGVAEGLQDGIRLQQLLFQLPLTDETQIRPSSSDRVSKQSNICCAYFTASYKRVQENNVWSDQLRLHDNKKMKLLSVAKADWWRILNNIHSIKQQCYEATPIHAGTNKTTSGRLVRTPLRGTTGAQQQ